jgi:hypothetical protein
VSRAVPVILVYLLLLTGRAATSTPYVDEGWYAMPAWNLATHGSFGTPVLEPSASPMPGMPVSLQGIRAHTYWVMMFPMLLKAGWFKIVGFSLLTTRLFSGIWAVAALTFWFFIMRRIGGKAIAILAVVLIGTDFLFVMRAVFGRDDMMSAALGYGGILAYLSLRDRSLRQAVILSNSLIVAAGLTHPNGGLVSLAGLLTLMVHLDRKRLGWRHAVLGLAPYIAGAGLMSIYILQAPQDFAAQFLGNSTGRFPGLAAIVTVVPREFMRYLYVYGLDTSSLAGRSKLVILAVYIAGTMVICLNRKLREQYRVLLLLTGAYVGTLTVFENYKIQHYAIYVTPFLCALTAAALDAMRPYRPRMTRFAIAGLMAFNLTVTCRLILRNGYRNDYLPAIHYLQTHGSPDGVVMASAEAGFEYGFRDNLIDDFRLGYNSGKRADFVLVDQRYLDFFANTRRLEPDVYRYIDRYLQTECVPVKLNDAYTIYVRRPSGTEHAAYASKARARRVSSLTLCRACSSSTPAM